MPLDDTEPPRGPLGPSRLELSKPVIAAVAGPALAGTVIFQKSKSRCKTCLVLTKGAILYLIVSLDSTFLEKIIRSKKALGRPKDKAAIDILEKTLAEKKKG